MLHCNLAFPLRVTPTPAGELQVFYRLTPNEILPVLASLLATGGLSLLICIPKAGTGNYLLLLDLTLSTYKPWIVPWDGLCSGITAAFSEVRACYKNKALSQDKLCHLSALILLLGVAFLLPV